MREIRFRAYNKDWKMMVQPEDIYSIYFDGVTNTACGVKFNITTTDGARHDNVWEDTDDLVLMQCTGLKSKSGVEIYEGDVLKIDDGCEYFSPEQRWQVYWECDSAGFWVRNLTPDEPSEDWTEMSPWASDLEVIGNIYENPELLK